MKTLVSIITLFAALALAHPVSAADAVVKWNNPTQNVDGSSIPATGDLALKHTRIEYSICNGTEFGTALGEIISPQPSTSAIVTGLNYQTQYCLRAFASNNLNAESAASNVVAKIIPIPVPNAPTLISDSSVVYEVKQKGWRTTVDVVGTAPYGIPCSGEGYQVNGETYYDVDPAFVTLQKKGAKNYVTTCEIANG